MARHGMAQVIEVDAPGPQSFDERASYLERAMVGQLARQAHERGEQFVGWPECVRLKEDPPLIPRGCVRLTVEVRTEKRP